MNPALMVGGQGEFTDPPGEFTAPPRPALAPRVLIPVSLLPVSSEPRAPKAESDPGQDPSADSETDPFAIELPSASPTQAFEAMAPVAGFLLVNRFADDILGSDPDDNITWAIGAATVLSILALIRRTRKGLAIGRFLPILTLIIIGRGLLGVRYDIYFELGIAAKYGIAVALAATALFLPLGGNAVGRLAPLVFGFGDQLTKSRQYQEATRIITLVGAAYYTASASFDIWLLQRSSVDGYVLWRTGVNWVVSSGVLLACAAYLSRRLSEIDRFPGLMAMFEERVEKQAAAWGWDLSDPNAPTESDPEAKPN